MLRNLGGCLCHPGVEDDASENAEATQKSQEDVDSILSPGLVCLILIINTVVFFMVLRVILQQGKRARAAGKVGCGIGEASASVRPPHSNSAFEWFD